jgi:hypothetical protein
VSPAKVFNQTQIIIVSFLQFLQILLGLLKCLISNLLLVLAMLQGLRQFGYLFFEVKIRRLSKSEVALKFLRFLRKSLVRLLLINEPFNGNFPKQGRFKSIIFLKLRKFGRRVRTKKVLKF